MDFCIYDDTLHTILITDKKLIHFKLSKSGQILHVDKTGFARPSHKYRTLQAYFDKVILLCVPPVDIHVVYIATARLATSQLYNCKLLVTTYNLYNADSSIRIY